MTTATSGFNVVPALLDLHHSVRSVDYDINALFNGSAFDVLIVDARDRARENRAYLDALRIMDVSVPVVAVFTEGGLVTLSREWAISDLILETAGPAEVEARLRVALQRHAGMGRGGQAGSDRGEAGHDTVAADALHVEVEIDASESSCTIDGDRIELTYVQLRLLSILVGRPDRAFTREHLLTKAWDHSRKAPTAQTLTLAIRGLRAALGRHRGQVQTVRGVGYRWSGAPTRHQFGRSSASRSTASRSAETVAAHRHSGEARRPAVRQHAG
ncbi:winged helix-turn-helix domain-containing protein [Jatrophihabitans sp. DSM 45814]